MTPTKLLIGQILMVFASTIAGVWFATEWCTYELGLSDEINDRPYFIVNGVDGRIHYVDIHRGHDPARQQALRRPAGQLSGELGLDYIEVGSGGRVEGVHRRSIELASARFALIEKSRKFTLVPWREVLERNLGKHVSGVMRGDSIS